MKTNKIHLYKRDRSHDRAQTACGATHKKSKGNIAAFKEFETDTPKELLCKTCLNTVFYDEKKAEFESVRPFGKGEFEELRNKKEYYKAICNKHDKHSGELYFKAGKTYEFTKANEDFFETLDEGGLGHGVNIEYLADNFELSTKDELDEPKKLKILSTLKALVVSNLNSEQFNKLYDFIESKKLDKYSNKNKGLIEVYHTKEDYNCVLDFINNGFEEPKKDFSIVINNASCDEVKHYEHKLKDCDIEYDIDVISEVDSTMKYIFADADGKKVFGRIVFFYYDELQKKKTQLDKDAEKFNLNKEQKEYLSGFDYEVVEFEYCSCNACLFNRTSIQCPRDEKGACSCQQNNKEYKFKQIHKTQSSLNKSIEKEGLKDIEKPFESVADVVDEILDDALNPQPSKYHRYFNEGWHDCYSISRKYNITDPAAQHGFKKALMPGDRGAKDIIEDVKEIIWSYQEYLKFLEK